MLNTAFVNTATTKLNPIKIGMISKLESIKMKLPIPLVICPKCSNLKSGSVPPVPIAHAVTVVM